MILLDKCLLETKYGKVTGGSFTKIWKDTMDLLVKGTAHTRMEIGGKTTVKTSATSDIGRLTKSLKKMKMNNLTFRQFSVSKCGDAF